MPVAEIDVFYRESAPGTSSKLSTFRGSVMIQSTIGCLPKEGKPPQSFGVLSGVLAVVSVLLDLPIVQDDVATGLVLRFPTAILASALMILAFLILISGVILEKVTLGRIGMKRMPFLSIALPLPASRGSPDALPGRS